MFKSCRVVFAHVPARVGKPERIYPGVTSPDSTERQVSLVCQRLKRILWPKRMFVLLNVSALHQPNCSFAPPATEDSPARSTRT